MTAWEATDLSKTRELIVGAGISGLALAGARGRSGASVEVIERHPEWQITSSGITLQPPAIRALDRLGLLDEVGRRGSLHDDIHHHDLAGNRVQVVTPKRLAGPDRASCGGIMRTELHEILLESALDAGANIRMGTTVTSLAGSDESATVELSDGATGEYDLVVGADGIRSSIRDEVSSPAAGEPRYLGAVVWRAVVPRHPAVQTLSLFHGPHVAGASPVSEDQMYIFALSPLPEPRHFERDELVPAMHELLAAFTNTMANVREHIVDPGQVVARPLWSCLVEPPWHRGRVVLIGDAVHAPPSTLATGGGMAMEDAVVLDDALRREPSVAAALERYTERRWARSRDSVQLTIECLEAILSHAPGPEIARLERAAHGALSAPL